MSNNIKNLESVNSETSSAAFRNYTKRIGMAADRVNDHVTKPKARRASQAADDRYVPSKFLEYSNFMFNNKGYAASETSKGSNKVMPYEWGGSYWRVMSEPDAKRLAFQWLESNYPNSVSDRTAGECVRTSLLKANKLPAKSRDIIIPLQDKWIKVEDNGDLVIMAPDMNVGVTYQINATLDGATGEKYVPKPLPEDSLLYRFLATSLPDPKVRGLVQEYMGYTFCPDTRHQVAMVMQGDGSNGKSVLMKLITHCHEKVASIRLDNMQKFGLIELFEASLAVSSETPKKGIDVEELKKCITGDIVALESKGVNQFSYQPFAKWIINCNTFPRLDDFSGGIWRRLIIVNWDRKFERHEIIQQLDDKIIEQELHLFIDWCLEGLSRLIREGEFKIPPSVRNAISHEQTSNDSVKMWIHDNFIEECGETFTHSKTSVYEMYRKYAEEQHMNSVGPVEFWKRMKSSFKGLKEKRGTDKKRTRTVNLRPNPLGLTQQEIDIMEAAEFQSELKEVGFV